MNLRKRLSSNKANGVKMSSMKELAKKYPQARKVIKDFLENPCCGEDEGKGK